MSKYSEACEANPVLKSFDAKLQQRIIKVVDSVTAKAETGSGFVPNHKIHMEVAQHLVEVSQDVADFILESGDDVWEIIPLKSLVKAYFENTRKTLDIFDTIKECTEKAELGDLVIQEAVAHFDKESADNDHGKKNKYEKTLKELKKYKAMGDPFDGSELKIQFKLIIEQQISLLDDVKEAKKELDAEIERVADELAQKQKMSFWSNLFFGAAAAITAVASIALVASGWGAPAGIAMAGVLTTGVVPAWAGVEIYLTQRMEALKKQQESLKKLIEKIESVDIGVETNEDAMESVSELVGELEKKIVYILKLAEDAIDNEGDEVDTKIALDKIKDKVGKLMENIKELGESVDNHSKVIRTARLHVLQKINGSGPSGKYQDA